MNPPRTIGLFVFLLGSLLFILIGVSWERTTPVTMVDFKTVYCGARALIEHRDPYNPRELERLYLTESAGHPTDHSQILRAVSIYIYPPTAFILTVPFALLPWGPAHAAWMFATAATLVFAAFLVWDLAATQAPIAAGLLTALFLITSELLIEVGNAAGIAVSLCVIAVVCFLRNRFVHLGILCLAISLLVKPHDSALVWLYFLLAGGLTRKLAIRTLIVSAVLALPFFAWTFSTSPHWIHEMQANLAAHQSVGDDSDPGPRGVIASTHGAQLISLQTALSLFRDDPGFYNPATWLICGALLLLWAIAVLRSRFAPPNAWLALAAISALSMLPTYHRQQDTRVILLVIPAFALLWGRVAEQESLDGHCATRASEGSKISGASSHPGTELASRSYVRWLALIITTAGILFTGDIPLQLLGILAQNLGASTDNLFGKLTMLFLARPAPLALLAVAVFYLWTYLKHTQARVSKVHDRGEMPAAQTAGRASD